MNTVTRLQLGMHRVAAKPHIAAEHQLAVSTAMELATNARAGAAALWAPKQSSGGVASDRAALGGPPKYGQRRQVSLRSSLQEGRNHLGCATKCCHSLLILLRPRVLQVRASDG